MLKYYNKHEKKCDNDKPGQFKLPDCNKQLLTNIVSTTNFLIEERCIFMTFDEYYTDKVHINNNIYCNSFTLKEKTIKETIITELNNIKNNLLKPSNLQNIPLPIYVMLAKKLVRKETVKKLKEEEVAEAVKLLLDPAKKKLKEEELLKKIKEESATYIFGGTYEVVLYIPNLMKLSDSEYTLFPSLDAFSKQNRWMELMTSKYSKYLAIIEIGTVKDKAGDKMKKNYLKRDLTNSCFNLGCVSDKKDTVPIPDYSSDKQQMMDNVLSKSPYIPKVCLQTPYYTDDMMFISDTDSKKYESSSSNLYNADFNLVAHCKKTYEKESFDEYLCDTIKLCDEDVNKQSDGTKVICEKDQQGRIETIYSLYGRKTYKDEDKLSGYSDKYNDKILKELAFRNNMYPKAIQEIVFSMFNIDELLFDENLFCYLPWGNKLLTQDYVLNEGDNFEIDRVSLKSFNNVFEIRFEKDGFLYLYQNKAIRNKLPNQSGSLKCFTNRVFKFENMAINIYGNDSQGNYDLRGFVVLPMKSMYRSPASIILSNNGELIIYDLGINNKSN